MWVGGGEKGNGLNLIWRGFREAEEREGTRHYREKEGIRRGRGRRRRTGLETEIHERVRLESWRRFETDFVGKKKKWKWIKGN